MRRVIKNTSHSDFLEITVNTKLEQIDVISVIYEYSLRFNTLSRTSYFRFVFRDWTVFSLVVHRIHYFCVSNMYLVSYENYLKS
jgi:hypothetical protein